MTLKTRVVLETGALVLAGTKLGTNLKTARCTETKGCRAGTVGTRCFRVRFKINLIKQRQTISGIETVET